MRAKASQWLMVALMAVAGPVAAADSGDSLAGTWSLDDRSSDDPVRELAGEHAGDGLGRRVVRSVNVFGFPVGSLPLPGEDEEKEEEPLTPAQVVGPSLAYAFEATYRLRITQNDSATEVRYGNGPSIIYRGGDRFQHDGWTSKVEWHGDELTVEHERPADGAHISERYWVEARAGELHWTVRMKRPKKSGTVDVKRVFYRAPGTQDAGLQLISARLLP
jgi:hypothetical protein